VRRKSAEPPRRTSSPAGGNGGARNKLTAGFEKARMRAMVNAGMVNAGGDSFLHAANFLVFRGFAPKYALQKVR
jgi:hypothetical protein